MAAFAIYIINNFTIGFLEYDVFIPAISGPVWYVFRGLLSASEMWEPHFRFKYLQQARVLSLWFVITIRFISHLWLTHIGQHNGYHDNDTQYSKYSSIIIIVGNFVISVVIIISSSITSIICSIISIIIIGVISIIIIITLLVLLLHCDIIYHIYHGRVLYDVTFGTISEENIAQVWNKKYNPQLGWAMGVCCESFVKQMTDIFIKSALCRVTDDEFFLWL